MTQRTRDIIANLLLVASVLFIVAFLVQHFLAAPRPSWHKDLVWLGLASVIPESRAAGRDGARSNIRTDAGRRARGAAATACGRQRVPALPTNL